MALRPVEEVLFETLQDISRETSPEVWAEILVELQNGTATEIYRSTRLSRLADVFLGLAVAFATTIVLIGFAHWSFIALMFLCVFLTLLPAMLTEWDSLLFGRLESLHTLLHTLGKE
jgi:hypothetical protein